MGEEKQISNEKEGFFFATEEDKSQNILTKKYENGSEIKKIILTNGKEAIVRKLRGRDFVETKKRIQNDKEADFETVNMSIATTIDGKSQPPEYFLDDLYQGDYAKLMLAYGTLNF